MPKLLKIIHGVPEPLYSSAVKDLAGFLVHPSLIYRPALVGDDPAEKIRQKDVLTHSLFISCLLHGNEHTGFLAVQKLLKKNRDQDLPCHLFILIGNVHAAEKNVRKLEHQIDFNRIWRDENNFLVNAVKSIWQLHRPFAVIDLHNNSGKNPMYACIAKQRAIDIKLARLFSQHVVHFTYPDSTLAVVASELLPAATLECGRTSEVDGVDRVLAFLERCINFISSEGHRHTRDESLQFYETFANIHIDPSSRLRFAEQNDHSFDLVLRPDLEEFNFKLILRGTCLGFINNPNSMPTVRCLKTKGTPLSTWLKIDAGRVIVDQEFIPSMLTTDIRAIREDCLGYLMREISSPGCA